MSEDILDKVMNRYGVIGFIVFATSVGVLFAAWLLVSLFYPPVFLAPILVSGWMIWTFKGGKDE